MAENADEKTPQEAPVEKPKRTKKEVEPEIPTHYRFLVSALGSYHAGQVVSAEELGESEIARFTALGAIEPTSAPDETNDEHSA